MKCWADIMGDCEGRQSAEHLFPESVFEGGAKVAVRGLSWCHSAYREIGVASFTSNILCRGHNSRLSPLDAVCTAFTSAAQQFHELTEPTAGIGPGDRPLEFVVDGLGLELALLKMTINYEFVGNTGWWMLDGAPARRPPERFVRACFERAPLVPPMGLYFLPFQGAELPIGQRILGFADLRDGEDRIGGAGFILAGTPLVLWLNDKTVPEALPGLIPTDGEAPGGFRGPLTQMMYRPAGFSALSPGTDEVDVALNFRWM